MPAALRYDLLTQKHPDYDAARYQQIEELYEGGWRIMRKAGQYLPKFAFEAQNQYEPRKLMSSYHPFFGQILDQFVSELFTQPLIIGPAGDAKDPKTPGEAPDPEFYSELASNIDGDEKSVETLAGELLTTALKHQCAYLMVDAPEGASGGIEPANLAEEDETGVRRCYAYEIPPVQIIDWKYNTKTKSYDWLIIATKEQDRETPLGSRNIIREEFTVWEMVSDASETNPPVAAWTRYALSYSPEQAPQSETPIPAVADGVTSFDRIPVLRLEMPKGLWVGNKIGPQALEHWRRRSALIGAENRSCVAIPFVSLGPELPAIGQSSSEAAEDPHRGDDPVSKFEKRGFLALGHEDRLDFAEPKGHCYEIIDKQIEGVREAMFSVNHQMAASVRPTGAALGRSGLSKQKDEDKTSKVLGALGRIVRKFFIRVYDTISKARAEDVVWVAHGLDSYEHDDREQVLEESLQLQAVNVPSATFRKEHAKRIVAKLVPNLPPETVAQIEKEIDEGVEDEKELQTLKDDAEKDAIVNPPPVVVPGQNGAPPKVVQADA